ncbi:MAG: cadmium-translocating P-type ATPase [Elusimicrobiota bacterium]|jgi:Cd2+/Zn2+-exporting ATPase|nr:cadmium-translocating P-type ATPase [Elusimicrobiota bacterium]
MNKETYPKEVKEKHHCSCCGDEDGRESGGQEKSKKVILLLGLLSFAAALIIKDAKISIAFFFLSFILTGGSVITACFKNILKGNIFNETFLMTAASSCAFIMGEFTESIAVFIFYRIGLYFEEKAEGDSRRSISELVKIRPEYANLIKGIETLKVSPEDVKIGDLILIKSGEKIPLDGIVIKGKSALNTSSLTGESLPKDVEEGSSVLAGFVNGGGILTVRVEKTFAESAVSKILNLIENASSKKSKTEKFITVFAKYYTPIVVFAALALAVIPPLILDGALFSDWLYRALIFLIISCPCALVISVPLSFFAGIGKAAKCKILIKGSNYIEALCAADAFVFDKTGTLTKGIFTVDEVLVKNNFSRQEVLEYAAFAQFYSSHPIALSIRKYYGKKIDEGAISDFEEKAGFGIKAKIKGRSILAGNAKLLKENGIDVKENIKNTAVFISIDKIFAGSIILSDEIKSGAAATIEKLKKTAHKTIMLTGDRFECADVISQKLNIDEFYAELLPHQKVEIFEEIKKKSKGKTVFIGDGINDAPVLAGADVGIAMGALGSDAAIEAADIVFLNDDISKITEVLEISKQAKKTAIQNIVLSLSVKGIILALGALGFVGIWGAIFADVGVAVIAILNSIKNLK